MPVTTYHRYLDSYPCQPQKSKMILGTMHPHRVNDFNIDFYYGNVGSFWDILGNAFPQHDFSNLTSILQLLDHYHIWITDIISECDRVSEDVTADEDLYNIVLNTDAIYNAIITSNIDTIYFTSRFGKNNAAKLFCKAFNISHAATFNKINSEFIIPAHHFGKQIHAVVLYSPSNDANRGIAKGALPYKSNFAYYKQFAKPVKKFKIEFYRQKFSFLD